MKKYLVVPDYVISKTDGQKHFITAEELISLYAVNPDECFIASHPAYLEGYNLGGENPLIILRPRYDGNYTLPEMGE